MQLILASGSPRRKALLSQIVPEFIVEPARCGEEVNISLFPEDIACALAEGKCEDVFSRHSGSTVIGCDTIVVFNGEILGKPKGETDACGMLKKLSGKTHCVITGVCIKNKYKKIVRYEKTEVKFNVLADGFIKDYVAGGSPMDKAGSYGIQDGGIVKQYYGSYTNVVGLPVILVSNMLKEIVSDL
ncbi:MAG: Maf family protein [Clostridia bacterium]|nr:Maf family protein [Clostridia bacterium]